MDGERLTTDARPLTTHGLSSSVFSVIYRLLCEISVL